MATPTNDLESSTAFAMTTTTTTTTVVNTKSNNDPINGSDVETVEATEAPPSSNFTPFSSPIIIPCSNNDNNSNGNIINNTSSMVNNIISNQSNNGDDNVGNSGVVLMNNHIDRALLLQQQQQQPQQQQQQQITTTAKRKQVPSIHSVAFSANEMEDNNDNDDRLSQSAASHVMHSSERDNNNNINLAEPWAAQQTRTVRRGKMMVLSVLLLSTVAMALTVYLYLSRTEDAEFHARFHEYAHKVLQSLGKSVDGTMGAVDSLIVSMVSTARATNQTWPFVTIPDFAIRASKTRTMSRAVYMNVYPVVSADQRTDWEEYTRSHDGWVEEGIAIQKNDPTYQGPFLSDYDVFNVIYDNSEFDKKNPGVQGTQIERPFYLPTWQSSPVIPKYPPYNWDLMSNYDLSAEHAVFDTHRPVISEAYMIPSIDKSEEDPAKLQELTDFADWFQDYIGPDEDPMEPVSDIYYPIFEQSADSVVLSSPERETYPILGFLALSIYWRDMIKDILPPGTDGIVIVFENPCNPTFTYEINGRDVWYMGLGDHHNSRFTHMMMSAFLLDSSNVRSGKDQYTGIPVNDAFCPFHVSLFPNETLEAKYVTKNPAVFTALAVMIFAFTSAVFLIYDYCVERRQARVMRSAVESAVTAGWLEQMVLDRTERLAKTNQQLHQANRQVRLAAALQLQHFACMSHEIRTPLNGIIGLSNLLLETELNASQRDSMQMIVSSGALLRAIVDDVLDFSKLESGKLDFEIQRCRLQDTLNVVVKSIMTRGLFETKQLRVRTFYDVSVPEYIHTDSRRVQQILFNLLGNAVKFSKEGGTIDLTVTVIPKSAASSSGTEAVCNNPTPTDGPLLLRFVVKDYGKGIDRKDFTNIFEPFHQVPGEQEVSSAGGTGLGLSISSRLAKGIGGLITVDSELGQWSAFTVDIPCDQAANMDELSQRLQNTTILLVENDVEDAARVISILESYRVDLVVASTLSALEAQLLTNHATRSVHRSYICLCRNDLYDPTQYRAWLQKMDTKLVTLLTFGTCIMDCEDSLRHYPSLLEVLPSVLIREMVEYMDLSAQRQQGQPKGSVTEIGCVEPSSFAALRILIAEDNIVNQKVLTRILQHVGIQNVVVVDNGLKAVEREASEAFDVVLMDMQMPVMDGIDACKRIVARSRSSQSPHAKASVVFVTATVSENFREVCFEAGADGFVAKPCNVQDVRQCLAHYVMKKQDVPESAG